MQHNKTGFSTFSERKMQEAEELNKIVDFFQKSGFNTQDLSENKNFFKKDIDLSISTGESTFYVEVKIDKWIDKTNNFFLEIISNERKSSMWCFLVSEADILLYYCTESEICYLFPLKKVQDWFFDVRVNFKDIKEIDKYFKLQSTHTKDKNWNYRHTTIGRVVSKQIFLKWLTKYNINYVDKKISEAIWFQEIKNILH